MTTRPAPLGSITPQIDELVIRAVTWWKGKRPTRYTRAQHLANPTVNTLGDNEFDLANAVAAYLTNGRVPPSQFDKLPK